jgi:hypothetical protein
VAVSGHLGDRSEFSGKQVGDRLISIGEEPITSDASFDAFRKRYDGTTAQTLPLVLRRDNASMTLQLPVRLNTRTVIRVTPLPNASAKAVKIRSSVVRGR